jgi:hypothetical protein
MPSRQPRQRFSKPSTEANPILTSSLQTNLVFLDACETQTRDSLIVQVRNMEVCSFHKKVF